jgi:integrase
MARPRKLESSPTWPKIRTRRRANGCTFMVDSGTPINGSRIQKTFPTLESAESYAAHLRAVHANSGTSAFKITDYQREDAVAALDALSQAECSISLHDAVEFYLLHHRPAAGNISLENLCEKFIENRRQGGLRPRSLHDLESRCGQFTRHIGGRKDIKTIATKQISDYIQRPGISTQTARNDWTVLHSLFQFAKHPRHFKGKATPKTAPLTGWIAANPLADIPRPTIQSDQMPSLIDLDAAARLLAAAHAARESDGLLPYVTLGLFAGLRPSEILSLDWHDIELTGKHPLVNIRRSKTRAGVRNVDLAPMAVEWLRLCPQQSGPVVEPKNFRRRWTRLLAAAKIESWPQDCLRHTFASVDYRIHQNANRTASLLGHSRAESVLFSHYRAAMPLPLATKFAALRPAVVLPDMAGNILPITEAAPAPRSKAPGKRKSA